MNQFSNELSPEERLKCMLPDINLVQMIYVVAKLGIPDLLRDGPVSIESLADTTKTHGPTLYRVLRALASEGIFSEVKSQHFALTPMAELLRTDVPGSMHSTAIWTGEPWIWRPTGELLHSVKTGETAFPHVFGMDFFDYFHTDEEASIIFHKIMAARTTRESAVIDQYDFGEVGLIIDIGAGHGALMEAILTKHLSARGLLFDLPEIVEGARDRLVQAGVIERCQLVGGNFFESVPEGGEIYILKDILHDWEDESIRTILGVCRQTMADNAKLLVIERVIPEGNDPYEGKIIDITMLALTGGKERTADEYQTLLFSSGFELKDITPTAAGVNIIEAVPV